MDLREYVNQFYCLTDRDYNLLTEGAKTKRYKKGDDIVTPGQTQRELLFVKKGVQMSYFESGDKIHVIAFTYPPNLCAIPDSFAFQRPSLYTLTCLSDTEADCLRFDQLQSLFDISQPIERLFRKMTEAILAGIITRHLELHSLSIEERFKSFCQRSAHLLNLVPHKYIASYLNIDPTNFSKLYNSIKF